MRRARLRIADVVTEAADGSLGDTVSPATFVGKFGTIPPMAPQVGMSSTPIRVAQSTPKALQTPFLAHHVTAESLQGRSIKGYTLDQLQDTDGAAWCGIKILRADCCVGIVLGVAVQSDEASKVWFSVSYAKSSSKLSFSIQAERKGFERSLRALIAPTNNAILATVDTISI